jgi:hypothetical protein
MASSCVGWICKHQLGNASYNTKLTKAHPESIKVYSARLRQMDCSVPDLRKPSRQYPCKSGQTGPPKHKNPGRQERVRFVPSKLGRFLRVLACPVSPALPSWLGRWRAPGTINWTVLPPNGSPPSPVPSSEELHVFDNERRRAAATHPPPQDSMGQGPSCHLRSKLAKLVGPLPGSRPTLRNGREISVFCNNGPVQQSSRPSPRRASPP